MSSSVSESGGEAPRPEGELSPTPPPESPVVSGGVAVGLLLAAGLAAGGLSWVIAEAAHEVFDPVLTLERSLSNEMFALDRAAISRSAALRYGTLAGLCGLALGLAGGLARRNLRAGLAGGVLGLLVGAAVSVGLAFALVPVFKLNYNPDTNDLLLPMGVHAGLWLGAGIGGGLGFAVGLGGPHRLLRSLVGGVVGVAVGTAAYEVLGAFLFATEKTVEPIAAGNLSRLLAHIAVALGVALVIATTLRERKTAAA